MKIKKVVHIKSPDKNFCTRVLALVEENKIIQIIKVLDVSIGCNVKERENVCIRK